MNSFHRPRNISGLTFPIIEHFSIQLQTVVSCDIRKEVTSSAVQVHHPFGSRILESNEARQRHQHAIDVGGKFHHAECVASVRSRQAT